MHTTRAINITLRAVNIALGPFKIGPFKIGPFKIFMFLHEALGGQTPYESQTPYERLKQKTTRP